jgi:hypothetical protein
MTKKKSNRRFAAIAAAVVVALVVTLVTGIIAEASAAYDSKILAKAKTRTDDVGFDFIQNPFKDPDYSFEVEPSDRALEDGIEAELLVKYGDVRSYEQILPPSEEAYTPVDVIDVSDEFAPLIKSSKQKICDYIDKSNVLKDKEYLKDRIQVTEFKSATYGADQTIGAYFSPKDGNIYINKNTRKEAICEWMFVHELVHALDYYTHGCDVQSEKYRCTLLDETITDLITESLNPKKIENRYMSGYRPYYELVSPYINLMGEKALNAYFYSYDEVEAELGAEEFQLYVCIIENFTPGALPEFYFVNLVYKWYYKG